MSRLSALLVVALSVPAFAVAPSDHVHQGVEPQRLMLYHVEVQQALRERPAWAAFLAGEGRGWTVRFDEKTGAPLRMFGPPAAAAVPGQAFPSESAPAAQFVQATRAWVTARASLLGIQPSTQGHGLGDGTAVYSAQTRTWYVDFPALYDGVPVWRGGLTARWKHGQLVMLGVETYDGVPRLGAAMLSADDAVAIAIDLGPVPAADHEFRSVRQVWLPMELGGALSLVRTFEVVTETADPAGRWVAHIDAETGEVLNVYNEILYFRGTVSGQHFPRRVTDPLTTSPLRDMRVEDENGRRVQTDATGTFDLPGTNFTATFRGDDLRVVDALDNQTASVRFGQVNVLITSEQASAPEINTWVHIQTVQEWGKRIAPEVDVRGGSGVLVSNVNVEGNCNAFYNGTSVNFYREGGGCNNTALLADVNYHEWGHGFHGSSILRGQFDGSLSEGAADTVAFLQTNDNIIAPTFTTRGGGIRDVAPDRVYPRDVVNQVHTDGLIFGGAMWDLLAELEPRYGRTEARNVAGRLLAGALKAGPSLATVGEEVLLADDDNGNLGDGTPHFCEILEAFGRHGLMPQTSLSALLQHDQVVQADPGAAVVRAEVSETLNLECAEIDDLDIVWRTRGGSWQRIAGASREGGLEGQLPELPYGTFVEYYLDTSGGVTVPASGEYAPLSMYVGGVLPVLWSTDFEADDAGFTSALVAGADQEGANDWMWGSPQGIGGDPGVAASGANVWGNDLGGGRFNGQYQPEKQNRLTSPELAFPAHLEKVFLRYARWLSIEDAQFDQARILADGEVVWTNHDSEDPEGAEHHQDDRWVIHSVDLGASATDGRVQLAWEIDSDQGLEFGGWTLDDVALFAPATPNNRLAVTDFVASDGTEGGVELTWTNPIYEPLAEVVVVRKEDGPPSGPTDGDVVYRNDAPELGAAVVAFDDTGRSGVEYHYAVFPGDGADSLGWTREGLNEDLGSGTGQPKNGRLVAGGCSCDSGGAGGFASFSVFLAMFAIVRRRRA